MFTQLPLAPRPLAVALIAPALLATVAAAPASAAGSAKPAKAADNHTTKPATNAPGAAATKEARSPVLRLTIATAGGTVSVHHAATGRSLMSTTLPAPASLAVLGDRRHVAAVMGTGNAVQLLDTGAWTEPHDDHTHSYVTTPRTVGAALASTRPSHVVGVGDDVVIYGDGSGAADRYSLAALAGGTVTPATTRAAFPHHGVGVPFGDAVLISSAPAAAARPDTVLHVSSTGAELGRFPGCAGLHGETSGEGWAAFGCANGTLLLEGSPLKARTLAYPAAAGALRVATWSRSRSGRHLVGALGTAGVLIVDRKTGTQHLTPLPGLVQAVAVDEQSGAAVALTRDGQLHRVAIGTGVLRQSAQVIAPFTVPAGAPAPRIAAAGGRVAVSEPATRRVVVAATATLRAGATIRVDEVPTQVALTGVVPTH